MLTIEQLKSELEVKSNTTIYKMIKQGLPFVTVGEHKRFILEDVIKWLKKNSRKEV